MHKDDKAYSMCFMIFMSAHYHFAITYKNSQIILLLFHYRYCYYFIVFYYFILAILHIFAKSTRIFCIFYNATVHFVKLFGRVIN